MFKKIIISASILCSLVSQAAELKTFKSLASAVSKGTKMAFVLNLDNCTSDTSLHDLQVSTRPKSFMLIGNEKVVASSEHFTLDEPGLVGRPILDFAKYTITTDGSMELRVTVMDARNYQAFARHQVSCQLGKGFRVFSD